jgi:hypothetical protein
MTKANWERRKNAGKTIRAEKSNLYIPPFDRNFDPNRHNRYVSRKRGAPHRNKVRLGAKKTSFIGRAYLF